MVRLEKANLRKLAWRVLGLMPILRKGHPPAFAPAAAGEGANAAPRRIGVFLQWGIGDAVLALPLLSALRRKFPAARLELIGKPWLDDLFAGTSLCDRTHVLVPPW